MILIEDADAPTPRPLVHGIVAELPGIDGQLPEGELSGSQPGRSPGGQTSRLLGKNSFLRAEVFAARLRRPGHGAHRYVFQDLCSLAATTFFPTRTGRSQVIERVRLYGIAKACSPGPTDGISWSMIPKIGNGFREDHAQTKKSRATLHLRTASRGLRPYRGRDLGERDHARPPDRVNAALLSNALRLRRSRKQQGRCQLMWVLLSSLTRNVSQNNARVLAPLLPPLHELAILVCGVRDANAPQTTRTMSAPTTRDQPGSFASLVPSNGVAQIGRDKSTSDPEQRG